jgi:hypothetical protein
MRLYPRDIFVVAMKAGTKADMGTGVRAREEIDNWLVQRRASFETAAPRFPQDEDFSSMSSVTYLMLRSASRRVSKHARH